MKSKIIYVDNNSTTIVDSEVFKAMKPFLIKLYGNPSSIHDFGSNVAKYIKKSKEQIAKLLNAESEEIIFTSSGSESNYIAILNAINFYPTKKKIIISKVEHPSILNLCNCLRDKGYIISEISVDKLGKIDIDILKKNIDNNTAIISIMWANNETGNIYPIEKIAKIAKDKGVFFHTDAVQAVGKIPINLKNSSIDMLSLSGHKLHAPKGIGALFVRKGIKFNLPFYGFQEYRKKIGTENVDGIIALGKAAEIAEKYMNYENNEVKKLRDYLESNILKQISKTTINGDVYNRIPNTSNISFEFVEGESILLLLNKVGIAASSGSACTTGNLEPSHVLKAMEIPYTFIHGSVRFSLSRFNTKNEMDKIIITLVKIIKKLRKISPYWK